MYFRLDQKYMYASEVSSTARARVSVVDRAQVIHFSYHPVASMIILRHGMDDAAAAPPAGAPAVDNQLALIAGDAEADDGAVAAASDDAMLLALPQGVAYFRLADPGRRIALELAADNKLYLCTKQTATETYAQQFST